MTKLIVCAALLSVFVTTGAVEAGKKDDLEKKLRKCIDSIDLGSPEANATAIRVLENAASRGRHEIRKAVQAAQSTLRNIGSD